MDLLVALGLAKQLIGWIIEQAALLAAQGDITEEEFNRIKAEAQVSDSAWDEAVAAAKARLQ